MKSERLGEGTIASGYLFFLVSWDKAFAYFYSTFVLQACGHLFNLWKEIFLQLNWCPHSLLSILSCTQGDVTLSWWQCQGHWWTFIHLVSSSSGCSLDLPASLAPAFFPRFPWCFLEWLWVTSGGRSRETQVSSFHCWIRGSSTFLLGLHCNHKSLLYGAERGKETFLFLSDRHFLLLEHLIAVPPG